MLAIRNIQKKFGSQTALSNIELTIREGEFFSLLGPSGCGKSTLLRILAGLEEASSGEIHWKDQRVDQLPARKRPFNMVFQKYALFPHLTVRENVAFGLKIKGEFTKEEISKRVSEAIELVQLSAFQDRFPETLSGGQQQRVALARALVNRPSCVLLDEPLGALDQKLRESMQSELRILQRRLGLTFILVTHDQEEAFALSDRIAIMNQGRIEQIGSPSELFETPASAFSARFVSGRNEMTGVAKSSAGGLFDIDLNGLQVRARSHCQFLKSAGGGEVSVFVPAEKVIVTKTTTGRGTSSEIVQIIYRGSKSDLVMALTGHTHVLRASIPSVQAAGFSVGEKVFVEIPADETLAFAIERREL